MKNFLLCAILGIAVLLCTVVIDYVYTDSLYEARLENKAVYASLDADPHRKYSGYTVEEMCEGYELPTESHGKKLINVPIVNQYPEMPVGCEIACTAALLGYLGYEDADKDILAEKYITASTASFYESDGILYGPDPNEFFVGDPYGKGFGCYADVVAEGINHFFRNHSSKNIAIVLNNTNSADLERLIDGGVPVIVWASIDMKPYRYNASSEWISDSTGETISWLAGSHTLVLVGYDDNFYYFMDCNDKDEIQAYIKETFLQRWEENGCRSVAVKLTE
ncbi:MAG: C39 family peptidase [Huintestinicola sp.]